jgi:predicted transcriptional regulator of viral defense system
MTITGPSWQDLYAVAAAQAGHFTTVQAAESGFSAPLLHKYLSNGRIQRVRRSVYRLVHFPASEEEGLVVLWLWSDRVGVFSHGTALARHELSDLLPSEVEMTVPAAWQRRRLRLPEGLRLHLADLAEDERAWHGPVPITTPARTLNDCAAAGVSPEFIEQAIRQGLDRGLFDPDEVAPAANVISPAAQP